MRETLQIWCEAIYEILNTLRTDSYQPVSKRRIALLKSLGRPAEAVAALNNLLDASPIDAEAWAELADLYVSQGMYPQGVFALEEVLLITPNAWNVSDYAPSSCALKNEMLTT